MPNENNTLIVGLIDRSGSMQGIAPETITGWNGFINEQKKIEGECFVTLALFDGPGYENWFEVVYDYKNIKDVPELTDKVYQPRGTTPLWASMIKLINQVGETLSNLDEAERPGKVIFLTMTDGYENASHQVDSDKNSGMILEELKGKVSTQEKVYNWQFTYLGANQDAIMAGNQMGVQATSSLNFNSTSGSVKRVYYAVSDSVCSFRTGASSDVSYTDKQRREVLEEKMAT